MKRKYLYIIIPIYLVIQLILAFLSQSPNESIDYIACYICVVLSFLMCFYFFEKSNKYLFTQLALLFTVIADYFLIILDEYYLLAMSVFLLAQVCYSVKIYFDLETKKEKNIYLIIRGSLTLLSIILPFIVLKENTDLLTIITVNYYVLLITSMVYAFILCKKSKFNLIFAVGLLLFVCCDFFVAISNFESYFDVSKESLIYKITYHEINFSWIFYVPSQTLLGISLIENKLKEKRS